MGSQSEATGSFFRSSFTRVNSRSSISSNFLFLVMSALGKGLGEEVYDESDDRDEERGELIGDEATTGEVGLSLGTGANEAKSSAAQAELKVFRPFGFLAGGSSFGSFRTTVALGALLLTVRLEMTSFRAVVRFFRGDSV